MNLKNIFFYFILWISFLGPQLCFTQDNAFTQLNRSAQGYKENTKALVIGISDYQHVTSLRFADNDAEEFSRFLLSNPFWNVKEDDLMLLTNENAKQGDILMGLQWILETTQENENVLFYFSGHGDVEKVGDDHNGFLLAHDSPKNNYPMGGTIAVSMLDSVFMDLIKKNVKITIIVDACKSGQLAGGMLGTGHTNESLSKKWENQTRILSSQPNQLSVEDTIWGGGRGVFSYYLIKGLVGFANSDADNKILIDELDSYLGRNISKQTLGTQEPVLEAPKKYTTNISISDEEQMTWYKDDHVGGEMAFLVVSTKSGEDNLLAECNAYYETAINGMQDFNRDNFGEVSNAYWKFVNCNESHARIKYEFMRNIINEINEIVQVSLTGERLVNKTDFVYGMQLIDELLNLYKGKKFVGKEHFENLRVFLKTSLFLHDILYDSYASLDDYQFFVETELIDDDFEMEELLAEIDFWEDYRKPINPQVFRGFKNSITWQDNFYGHHWFFMELTDYFSGETTLGMIFNRDTIVLGKAIYPDTEIKKSKDLGRIEKNYTARLNLEIDSAISKEPDAAYLKYIKAGLNYSARDEDAAEKLYLEAVQNSPKWLTPLYMLGVLYEERKEYDKALEYYSKVLELDSIYQDFECVNCFYMGMLNTYLKADDIEGMKPLYEEWTGKLGSDSLIWYWNMGITRSAHDDKFKKGEKYWLDQLWSLTDYSLKKQCELLAVEMDVYPKKYKDEDVLAFIRDVVNLTYYDGARAFFLDTMEKRSDVLTSMIIERFFPDDKIIFYEVNDDPEKEQLVIFEHLSSLMDAVTEKHIIVSKKLLFESFFLETIIHETSLENYLYWLQSFSSLVDYYDLRETWKFYQDEGLELDECFEYTFRISEKSDHVYWFYYRDPISPFIEKIDQLMNGIDIRQLPEHQKIISTANDFEDAETVKEINAIIDKILEKSKKID